MNRCTILLTLLIFSQGCKDHEGVSVSSDESSNRNINLGALLEQEGQLTFAYNFQSLGSCTFQFLNDGKVVLSSFAYNICKFQGTFREQEGDILISFDKNSSEGGLAFLDGRTDPDVINLPPLRIRNTSEGFALFRKDERTDFKEHWNIYPVMVDNIFPLRIVTMDQEAEQAVRGNAEPATR